jgi:hypothetical protein
MKHHSTKSGLSQGIFLIIAMSMSIPAFAGQPPPGVPKKNVCGNNLTAVKVFDLAFGDFDGTTAGTITISTGGARSSTGPYLAGGTYRAASFDVSNSLAGCDYYPVKIRLPIAATDLVGAGAAMPADTFVSSPATQLILNATPGVATSLDVGATITTSAAQTEGTYTTTAPFSIILTLVNP